MSNDAAVLDSNEGERREPVGPELVYEVCLCCVREGREVHASDGGQVHGLFWPNDQFHYCSTANDSDIEPKCCAVVKCLQ
jgi:hypothetical protein